MLEGIRLVLSPSETATDAGRAVAVHVPGETRTQLVTGPDLASSDKPAGFRSEHKA
jgi:hypothetical protein